MSAGRAGKAPGISFLITNPLLIDGRWLLVTKGFITGLLRMVAMPPVDLLLVYEYVRRMGYTAQGCEIWQLNASTINVSPPSYR